VDESRCHTGCTGHFSLISTYSRLRAARAASPQAAQASPGGGLGLEGCAGASASAVLASAVGVHEAGVVTVR